MKTMIMAVTIALSASAFAQEIDYQEINKKNSDLINGEYESKIKEGLKAAGTAAVNVAEFTVEIGKNVLMLNRGKLPPARFSFSEIESSQIKLIKCLRKFIRKNKGGYDGPVIAQNILNSAMKDLSISNDISVLETAAESCRVAYNELYNFSDRVINLERKEESYSKLDMSSAMAEKTASFLKDFAFPDKQKAICQLLSVDADASLLLGAGAGVQSTRCLIADGTLKSYVGVTLKITVGAGVTAGLTKDVSGHLGYENNDALSIAISGNNSEYYDHTYSHEALVIGGTLEEHNREKEFSGARIGIGSLSAYYIAPGVRFFNGKTRWEYLIKKLK